MQSYYVSDLPRITKLTRFLSGNNETLSLRDQIWTICFDNVSTGIISTDITDHFPVFFCFPNDNEKRINGKNKINFRDQSPDRT